MKPACAISLKQVCMVFFVLAAIAPCFSQQKQEKPKRVKLELLGELEYTHNSYFKEAPGTSLMHRNQLDGRLRLKVNEDHQFQFFTTARALGDPWDENRNTLRLEEAYFKTFNSKVVLTFGKQIMKWGESILYSPIDRIFPYDFYDLLDRDKTELGVFALRGVLGLKKIKFEGLAMPFFQSSLLPGKGNRWEYVLPTSIELPFGAQYLTVPAAYQYVPQPRNTQSWEFGLKTDFTIRNMDVGLSYFHGKNKVPLVLPASIDMKNDTAVVALSRSFEKYQQWALSLSTFYGAWNIRGETLVAKHADTDKNNLPVNKPYMLISLGTERLFDFPEWNKSLQLSAQYIQEVPFPGVAYSNLNFNHLFQSSLLCKADFQWNFRLTSSVQGVMDLKNKAMYFQPLVRYTFPNNVQLAVFSDLLFGDEGSLLGYYTFNRRAGVELKYAFGGG